MDIGTIYFELLMSNVVVCNMATASYLRKNLTSLDSYLSSVNSKVELLNLHVKEKRQGVKAGEESTEDLITNQFKGCLATSDKDFVF